MEKTVDNFHNSWSSQEVIHDKIILKAWFLSNQVIFLYLCEPNLTIIYHVEIIFQWIHKLFSVQADIHKPRVPVCKYFFCLQIMMNGNKPLDWLGDVWFMEGQQIRFLWKQTNKQTKKSAQCSKESIMTTRWTRGGGKQAQGKERHW